MVGGKKKSKEEYYSVSHKNYLKFKFLCPHRKAYLNTATPTHLHTVCASFLAKRAELGTCDRQSGNVYYLPVYRKRFARPWSRIRGCPCEFWPLSGSAMGPPPPLPLPLLTVLGCWRDSALDDQTVGRKGNGQMGQEEKDSGRKGSGESQRVARPQ